MTLARARRLRWRDLLAGLAASLIAGVFLGMPARANNDCSRCHTCAAPTADAPCVAGCTRDKGKHARANHGVDEAPDVILIDKLASQYGGAHFNHKLHAGMSQMGQGCAVCHHYCPPGKIPACKSCHPAEGVSSDLSQPGLKGAYHRQCLQCHREWSHEANCSICHLPKAGAAKSPQSAAKAPKPAPQAAKDANDATDIMGKPHPLITAPDKREYVTPYAKGPIVTFYHQGHVDQFGLRCVDCHQQESCANCHDLKKPASKKKTMEEVHAVCSSCHKQDKCERCHDTSPRPAFSHDKTGWPLNRFHQGLSCRACHPTGKPVKKLKSACTACHAGWAQGKFRHAVTGLTLDETHAELGCTDCHPGLKPNLPPTCDGCHDKRDPAKNPPGKRIKATTP
jgi:hypothetical protein